VADALGFAHYTFDRRALFARSIVDPFVAAYLAGETPSPCHSCNRGVKLSELFAIADRLGASRVATGHYARVVRDGAGQARLATGRDRAKDQSYFLYACGRAWLERLLFPLGESTKAEVRAEALARRLPGAGKGESQELCFVEGAYADFVGARAGGRLRPGPIVDDAGRTVGTHDGVHRFTVGQRKGLGVALGRPVFVTRIDAEAGVVEVGDEAALRADGALLADVSLAEGVTLPVRARVRIRYQHEGEQGLVREDSGAVRVAFDRPVRALTPGQVAVFYAGERVLGGGRIRAVDAPAKAAVAPSPPA
jgi:tRNA-specific 2-thiouridylase